MFAMELDQWDKNPLSLTNIENSQQADNKLKKIFKDDNPDYHIKNFFGGGKTRALVCYEKKSTYQIN